MSQERNVNNEDNLRDNMAKLTNDIGHLLKDFYLENNVLVDSIQVNNDDRFKLTVLNPTIKFKL